MSSITLARVTTQMKGTILAVFFALWLVLAIGTLLFYRRRDFAFRKRWNPYVYGLHVALLGGATLLITVPDWTAFAVFSGFFLFLIWFGFRTRVCLGCGKISAPDKIIVPARFCSQCGTALD